MVEYEYPQRYPRILQTSMNNRNAQQTALFDNLLILKVIFSPLSATKRS